MNTVKVANADRMIVAVVPGSKGIDATFGTSLIRTLKCSAPLSEDTSACVSAGFRDFDLRAMMLTNPEGPGEEAAMTQGMTGLLITFACLNEEEWQAASPALDLPPDGREAMQCVMDLLGGTEGVAASLESKEGEPPRAFFNAVAECGLTMMGGPPPG